MGLILVMIWMMESSSNEDDEMNGVIGAIIAPQQPTTNQPTTAQSASTDDALPSRTAGTTPSPAVPTPTTPTSTHKEYKDKYISHAETGCDDASSSIIWYCCISSSNTNSNNPYNNKNSNPIQSQFNLPSINNIIIHT